MLGAKNDDFLLVLLCPGLFKDIFASLLSSMLEITSIGK